MIPEVAVETNWILDVALEQDPASQELFAYAVRRDIQLFLPSFSIAEAIKSLEAKQRVWRDLSGQLQKARGEFGRSTLTNPSREHLDQAITALAYVHDLVETRFWAILGEISRVTRITEATPQILELTAQIRDFLKLSPADSAVLATVVSLKKAGSSTQENLRWSLVVPLTAASILLGASSFVLGEFVISRSSVGRLLPRKRLSDGCSANPVHFPHSQEILTRIPIEVPRTPGGMAPRFRGNWSAISVTVPEERCPVSARRDGGVDGI